jgi:putative ABC transport system substrate-binding protein
MAVRCACATGGKATCHWLVILTGGDSQVLAAKRATAVTPIVFAAAGDPVGNGLVASLARPGGNVTGLSVVLSETAGKRLELLREVIPGLKRLAIFGNSTNPTVAIERDAVLTAAHALNLDTINSGFRREEDIGPAISRSPAAQMHSMSATTPW